jgi:N-acetylglucosamine repressor
MNANIDAATMRRMNRATVLRLIRDFRTTSRIDIAQITGLNKATVSNIVDELMEDKFVHEIGYGSSSGGRKPILLRFNANAAHAVGMEVKPSQLTTVVCNIRGETAYHHVIPVDLRDDSQDKRAVLLTLMAQEIQAAIDAAPKSPYGLVGVCVGLPGMVNYYTGKVYYLAGITTEEWDLKTALTERFSVPIFCDNNANCGAWNEYLLHGERPPSLVYVNAGAGVGAGIVIDGKLFRGQNGSAGEFGHMTINPMGSRCACGNYGCWEEYASERSLLRYIQEAGTDDSLFSPDSPLIDQVLHEASRDNRAYIRAFHSLGQYLGIGITNIINALNPAEIVLGGSLAGAATFVLPEIERVVNHRTRSHTKHILIRIGNVNSVAIGAACLTIEDVLFTTPADTGVAVDPAL